MLVLCSRSEARMPVHAQRCHSNALPVHTLRQVFPHCLYVFLRVSSVSGRHWVRVFILHVFSRVASTVYRQKHVFLRVLAPHRLRSGFSAVHFDTCFHAFLCQSDCKCFPRGYRTPNSTPKGPQGHHQDPQGPGSDLVCVELQDAPLEYPGAVFRRHPHGSSLFKRRCLRRVLEAGKRHRLTGTTFPKVAKNIDE